MAAAAVVLIVVGIGWDYHNSSVMMSNAGDCIEFASSQLPREIINRGDGKDLHELFQNVQNRIDLKETIDELEGYYAEDVCVEQVALALATAYIYDGQKSKAKEILNQLINDPDAAPEIKDKAKQMLDNIRKTFIF